MPVYDKNSYIIVTKHQIDPVIKNDYAVMIRAHSDFYLLKLMSTI